MEGVYEKEFPIVPSVCDAGGHLSYPAAFSCFMDIASQHAEALGVGYEDLLSRGLFWLTVKTKIVFLRRPSLGEITRLSTWPEAPGRIRCNRSYEMRKVDERLLYGRTEWAVVEIGTQRMIPASEVYPDGIRFPPISVCDEPFRHMPDQFDGIEPYAQYTVRSTDIDVGGHMNNAAYLNAMMGTFSGQELSAKPIRSIDALFRAPCFEGDKLIWRRTETINGMNLCAKSGDKTVFLATIET